MPGQECPSAEELDAFVGLPDGGGESMSRIASHLASCEACRSAADEIRENNRFLTGFVEAVSGARPRPEVAVPDVEPPVSPDLVPGYRIIDEIHRGGQGIVYRAEQTQTRRTVAIKMLLSRHEASPRQQERFEREARMAAALRHPNIVTIYDSGFIAGGRYGLAMEYVDGVTLDAWSRSLDGPDGRAGRRRALRARFRVMERVCSAVLCAHQHAIVHRDLKPANILVDGAGEPHVLDFGIAHQGGTDERVRLTHTGEFAGTLAYASPEQVAGDPSQVDTRTDIYSLGVIMYELVTGRMPYEVKGPLALAVRNIESAEPAPLVQRDDPDSPVDTDIATIIFKALAKDPARRYATVAGLRRDIERYLAGEPIEARRDQTWYVLAKGLRKHRGLVTAAAMVLFAMLLSLAGLGYGVASARQAHLRERIERDRTAEASRRAQAVAIVLQEVLPARESAEGLPASASVEEGLSTISTALDTGWLALRPALASDIQEVLTEIYRVRQTRFGWNAEMAARNSKILNSGLYGPDHPRTLASAHHEASAMLARGRLSDAERLARSNLQRRLGTLGAAHPDTVAGRALLAQVLLALGRAAEADSECRATLDGLSPGSEDTLETAGVRRTDGRALLILGRHEAAFAECILALRAHMLEFRDVHPEVTADLRLLADIFADAPPGDASKWPAVGGIAHQWDQPAAALRMLASALEGPGAGPAFLAALPDLLVLKGLLLPDEPSELAETHALLGRALAEAGDTGRDPALLAQAGEHFMEAARILETTLGPNHLAIANCYDLAGETCFDVNRPLAAEAARRSVRIWRSLPTDQQDPLQMASQERGAADILMLVGQYSESEELYAVSLAAFEQMLGPDSYVVATTHSRYAELLRRTGRLDEAEQAARRGHEVGLRSGSGPPDQQFRRAFTLGSILQDQGRSAEAQPVLFEALGQLATSGDSPRNRLAETLYTRLRALSLSRGDLPGAGWYWRQALRHARGRH